MQKMHNTLPGRPLVLHSLDAIISVGYRFNSRRGTQFRMWATRVLKDHLVRGYTANERRLKELRQSPKLVQDVEEPLADNALVALTIMIAASDPAEKDIIVNLAINLIDGRN